MATYMRCRGLSLIYNYKTETLTIEIVKNKRKDLTRSEELDIISKDNPGTVKYLKDTISSYTPKEITFKVKVLDISAARVFLETDEIVHIDNIHITRGYAPNLISFVANGRGLIMGEGDGCILPYGSVRGLTKLVYRYHGRDYLLFSYIGYVGSVTYISDIVNEDEHTKAIKHITTKTLTLVVRCIYKKLYDYLCEVFSSDYDTSLSAEVDGGRPFESLILKVSYVETDDIEHQIHDLEEIDFNLGLTTPKKKARYICDLYLRFSDMIKIYIDEVPYNPFGGDSLSNDREQS